MTLRELPLFPLRTVLFPGMVLPLHIFETRYRIMIDACLREKKPFGVLLIREGHEVGRPAITHRMGTSAYITESERLPDGRMNIMSVGYQRFSLQEIREDRPYQVGVVEDAPLPTGDELKVKIFAKELGQELLQFLKRLHSSGGKHFELDTIPEDGHALAYLTAIVLTLSQEEKQSLLEARDVEAMLMAQRQIVRRESGFLRYGLGQEDSSDLQLPLSMN